MKRYLQIAVGGLLVFALASPLYAAPDIKVTGQVRVRLRYWVDLDLDSDLRGGADRRYWDNRTRFGVDAKLAEGVRARIELEKYFDFGNVGPNSARSGATAGAGELATIGGTPQEPYFRQAWIDFAIPGLPEGWRLQAGRSFFNVGHQNIWGNSLTGEDGLTLYGPIGPGTFKGRYAITQNQSTEQAGRARYFDNELHNWAVDYKFDVAPKQTVEFFFIGQNDRAVDNYTSLLKLNGDDIRRGDDYWVGGAYSGFAGPVTLKFEGAYQFGKTKKEVAIGTQSASGLIGPCLTAACVATASTADDLDRSAGFLMFEGTYKVVPQWSTGVNLSYATGDNDAADKDVKNFVGPLASFTASPTRVFTDSGFFFGNRTGRFAGNTTTNRLWNFWGRGTNDFDSRPSLDDSAVPFSPGLLEVQWKNKYVATDQVSLFANLNFLWADKDKGCSSCLSTKSKYLGTEINGKVAYKPYKNLITNMYFGYWFTGDFFDVPITSSAASSTTRRAKDNAWVFRAEMVVTF